MFNSSVPCLDAVATWLGIFDPSVAPRLLFYSYIPATILALTLASIILFREKFALRSRLLFAIGVSFSLWVLNIIVQWVGVPADLVMLGWELTVIFEIAIFISAIYFVYVFAFDKDLPQKVKWLASIPVIAVLALVPTKLNIESFDLVYCEGLVGPLWKAIYGFEIFSLLLVLVISSVAFIKNKAKRTKRKQVLLVSLATILFLGLFSASNIFGEITGVYEINLVGPLGMVLFIGFLSYMIVQYHTFRIKVLGTQVLVWGLWVVISSQFFFIQNSVNRILTGFTLLMAIIGGVFLIRSVKREVEQREKLQELSEELKAANVHLEQLDKAKDEFISMASHQLRTPLTTIKGYLSMLTDGDAGKINLQQRAFIDNANTGATRMAKMIGELLNVSRMSTGKFKIEPKEVDLAKVVEEEVSQLMIHAEARDLNLQYKKPAKPVICDLDEDKTRQVIMNFIDNAIYYTKKGSITVTVEEAQNEVFFKVKDTGIGVPDSVRPKLFSKFYRADNARTARPDGTGLGLFLAKRVVEDQGGKIIFESEEGKGSTFGFGLPKHVKGSDNGGTNQE